MKTITIMIKSSLLIIISVIFFNHSALTVKAETGQSTVVLRLDASTVSKGYTAAVNNQDFLLAVWPKIVNQAVTVKLQPSDIQPGAPTGFTPVSDYWLFNILSAANPTTPIIPQKPYTLAIKFTSDNLNSKKIYYWNKPTQAWVALPTTIDWERKLARAYTHLPFSRLVVLEEREVTALAGTASWYRDRRYSAGAALNTFPLGTRLQVTNLANHKSVEVEVVSTWENYGHRIIDLTSTAFAVIADLGEGLIQVRVEKIN